MQSVAVLGYLETFSAVVLSAVLLAAGGDESPAASGRGMHLRRRYACGDEWEKDKVLLFRIKEAVKHSLVSPLLFVQAPFST